MLRKSCRMPMSHHGSIFTYRFSPTTLGKLSGQHVRRPCRELFPNIPNGRAWTPPIGRHGWQHHRQNEGYWPLSSPQPPFALGTSRLVPDRRGGRPGRGRALCKRRRCAPREHNTIRPRHQLRAVSGIPLEQTLREPVWVRAFGLCLCASARRGPNKSERLRCAASDETRTATDILARWDGYRSSLHTQGLYRCLCSPPGWGATIRVARAPGLRPRARVSGRPSPAATWPCPLPLPPPLWGAGGG